MDSKKLYIATISLIGMIVLVGCKDKEQIIVTQGEIVVDNNINMEPEIEVEIFHPEESNNQDVTLPAEFDERNTAESETEDVLESDISDTDNQEIQEVDEIIDDTKEPDALQKTTYESTAVPGTVETISLNPGWLYADYSKINSGSAKLYRAAEGRRNVVIGINAGHGTKGGSSVKTYCHPDMSAKVTGGTTAAGSVTSAAVSGGMTFLDGTAESIVTLRMAEILRDKLLGKGYDVLMLRDSTDVQLDNIARTVIGNNVANCIISLHWDGDNLTYDKGCFYISTPDGIKGMEPVASHYTMHEALGKALITGLKTNGCKIYSNGSMSIDLTQTSFSTVASVDIELGNAASLHDDGTLMQQADGLVAGIMSIY